VEEAVEEVYEVKAEPRGIGGSTVAAFFRQVGYPVVVWSRSLGLAHQVKEHCLLANMVGDAKVFAHVFLNE
jgi:succinyl-diaminopimelate desuccinylase